MKKTYNIGLDIGTTSVGWAVVDDDFNIIKKGNKRRSLWGANLFETAETAVSRRGARSMRRRYDRRRQRIKLLQDLFSSEINKVDANFYQKLRESFFNKLDLENKTIKLTNEEKQQIKKYYKEYPTIYHLRYKLMTSNDKMDIRLVYLAMHHIIKYRGNFNYQIDNFTLESVNIKEKLQNILANIDDLCSDILIDEISGDNIDYQKLEEVFNLENNKDMQKALTGELKNILVKESSSEFAKALIGFNFDIEKLFNVSLENNNSKMSFSSPNFDENIEKFSELGDKMEILIQLKELYDSISLKKVFQNEDSCSISKLMVNYYNEHKKDKLMLKELIRDYRDIYLKIFKNTKNDKDKEELCLYEKYIRNNISYDDFVNGIRKLLEPVKNDLDQNKLSFITEKMEKSQFLPRLTDSSNGKYPYQINQKELEMIIDNQSKYYPFLLEKIDDEYKIVKLLTFRIPYYVGPLVSKEHSKFAWMIRKQEGEITPFNFEEKVDLNASAKEFIYRMIGRCTYLLKEPQMPSNSILYSKFKVLNELKQIKIGDRRLDLAFQHKIYEEFFLKKEGSLTDKKFKDYLMSTKELPMYNSLDITGYSANGKFANTMQSYIDFFGKNGIFKDTNLKENDAEKIIELITILEDKQILREEILETYPELNSKIERILRLNYKGFSGLSKKLLTQLYYKDEETSLNKSIMDLMYDTKENFMQIINNKKYGFQELISKENKFDERKLDYSLVDELATSPSNKKGIYQALKVVEELVDYMGYEPQYVAIEMARSDDKKVRTEDRKSKLLKLYNDSKSKIYDYKRLSKELQHFEKINEEKLYLYFLQEGKSLYSMTPLDINNLSLYEVDHILPRTLIKDDSLDNKALVLRDENQNKLANLTLPQMYRTNQNKAWWRHLKDIGVMSAKKFNNLTRENYSDNDIQGFINRQLVETRQITKHVGNIINSLYKNTKIVYVKANVTHNYRERFGLYKYRQLNDYHHAHDAYLSIVLGIYQSKYLRSKINKEELHNMITNLIINKRYNQLRYGYLVNSIDQELMKGDPITGETFDVEQFTNKIENNLYRNDILISKKREFKTGELFNQTMNKKGTKDGVPLKRGLSTEMYGAYTRKNPAYAIVVRYQKKNNIEQRMIGIPIYIDCQNNDEITKEYVKELLNIDDVTTISFVSGKIPFYTIVEWNDGQIGTIVGASNYIEVCNFEQFKMSKEKQILWKQSLNRLFNKRVKGIDDLTYDRQLTDIINYVKEKIGSKEYKLYHDLLDKLNEYLTLDKISTLSIDIKEKVLLELFRLLSFNSENANLKILDSEASSAFGKKHHRIISTGRLIFKSCTGLKEKIDEF